MAGMVILAAVVAFMAMYPIFRKNAAKYDEELLQSEEFLSELYRANFVLYKELQDVVRKDDVSFSELFLELEAEKGEATGENKRYEDSMTMDAYGYEEAMPEASLVDQYLAMGVDGYKELAQMRFNELLGSWQVEMHDNLTKRLHYCMVDKETGLIVSNVKGDILKLGTEDADENMQAYYPYYVKMSFDSAGNLTETSVKAVGAEDFLDDVQRTMKRREIRNDFWMSLDYRGELSSNDTIYFYNDGNPYKVTTKITNGPKNAIVCYAIAKDQMEAVHKAYTGNGNISLTYEWNQWYAFYHSGMVDAFYMILIAIAVIALLLPFSKHYRLQQLNGVKVHLEFSMAAIVCWFFFASELSVYMMNWTERGYFLHFYEEFLYWLPGNNLDGILEITIHVVGLFFVFAVWYYLITTLGEVRNLGLWGFLKERSILVKLGSKLKQFVLEKETRFKEELLHVNLSEKTNKTIAKVVIINFLVLALCCLMWMFGWLALLVYSVFLYLGLKKYVEKIRMQYGEVLLATKAIADGNLSTELAGDFGVFESYKEELVTIQSGFQKAVEQEVKSQRMKTELITNVSHDLKTPLTAIMTYVELLEDETITKEQQKEYVGVLKKKSERLKVLIEDLFEVSKASSGNVSFHPVDVDICNLMRQVYLEYEDKVQEAGLLFRFDLPEEKVILRLDSQKTYRVFENLYTNIIKYAMQNTRVYINGEKTEEGIKIELKNMSATELNIAPEELTERFVRGDSSRNTEGSGLGLAIARSFVELQGGSFEVGIDGDLFKVVIIW